MREYSLVVGWRRVTLKRMSARPVKMCTGCFPFINQGRIGTAQSSSHLFRLIDFILYCFIVWKLKSCSIKISLVWFKFRCVWQIKYLDLKIGNLYCHYKYCCTRRILFHWQRCKVDLQSCWNDESILIMGKDRIGWVIFLASLRGYCIMLYIGPLMPTQTFNMILLPYSYSLCLLY